MGAKKSTEGPPITKEHRREIASLESTANSIMDAIAAEIRHVEDDEEWDDVQADTQSAREALFVLGIVQRYALTDEERGYLIDHVENHLDTPSMNWLKRAPKKEAA